MSVISIIITALVALVGGLSAALKISGNRIDTQRERAEDAENEVLHANQRAESSTDLHAIENARTQRDAENEKANISNDRTDLGGDGMYND